MTQYYKLRDWIPLDKIDWSSMSKNPNPSAVNFLEQNIDNVCWYNLSQNPNAICILEKNIDKINWKQISMNPSALRINWFKLSGNSSAIHILEKNMDKICWHILSGNPSIFELDYNKIRTRMDIIKEEMMQRVFHPRNIDKFADWGFSI